MFLCSPRFSPLTHTLPAGAVVPCGVPGADTCVNYGRARPGATNAATAASKTGWMLGFPLVHQ
eukprot:2566829-Prymnesium_polylepis.2